MSRKIGTVSRGIRAPIIREGDDLCSISIQSLLDASKSENFSFHDKDVICLTESIVARSQGNYISIDILASDVRKKLGGETIGVIFPILSRNRFAMILKGLARGCKKIFLMLSYPHDEVGNSFLSYDELDEKGINPKNLFGIRKHEFTGVDYVEYYEKIITSENCQVEIIFANQAKAILKYTDVVLACDIHTRSRTKKILKKNGAKIVLGLDDLCTESINGSGFNEKYGLLGSNKATEEKLKLFPKLKESQELVEKIQAQFLQKD